MSAQEVSRLCLDQRFSSNRFLLNRDPILSPNIPIKKFSFSTKNSSGCRWNDVKIKTLQDFKSRSRWSFHNEDWSKDHLDHSERLKGSWLSYHLERIERLDGLLWKDQLERSKRLNEDWSKYHLEQSEGLRRSWLTYHLKRSERPNEDWSTYNLDRSMRPIGSRSTRFFLLIRIKYILLSSLYKTDNIFIFPMFLAQFMTPYVFWIDYAWITTLIRSSALLTSFRI